MHGADMPQIGRIESQVDRDLAAEQAQTPHMIDLSMRGPDGQL